jgi:prolyl oligopeptidase
MLSRLARLTLPLLALATVSAGPPPPPSPSPSSDPPPTPTVDHVERLFGMAFHDPYYWMEAGGPRFDEWLAAQTAYSRSVLDGIPGRLALLEDLRRLEGGETQVSGAVQASGQWVYSKTRPEDASPKIFAHPLEGGEERVLVDPSRYDADGHAAQIDYWSIAPDGQHIAYGISLGGAETGVLRIMNVMTGAELPEHMDRTRYARPNWLDGGSFLYTRLPAPPPGKQQRLTGGQVFLHRLGTDPGTDKGVFGPGLVAGLKLPETYFFRGVGSAASRTVVGEYDAGLVSSPKVVFAADTAPADGKLHWRKVAGFEDDVRGVILRGDSLYLRTARDASRQRILRTKASAPDLAHAETILAEGTGTITSMVAAADALYVELDEGGLGRLVRIPPGGRPETLTTPFEGSFMGLSANAAVPGVVLRMQSWTRSQTVFFYDPATKHFADTGIAPPSPVSFADIEWTETRVPASDGTMVPISIVAPANTKRDGSHPVLLYAYGAYGVTLHPRFDAMRRAWFDHSGVYVFAHVRGSGGFGDDWHRGGRLDRKLNSITDFIAVAEYLEREGWASRGTLTAMGGSAGGIVIGGAIAARPELFAAALIQVGLVNMLRLEQIPIGPFNTGEFGSTETEEGVRQLYAIDAYQQLRKGVEYPGVLVATARNDARVSPWMPAKFAAKLQADSTRYRPDLLRVEEAGGHARGTREQAEAEEADFYSFLLWQTGMAGFQPGK